MLIMSQERADIFELKEVYISREENAEGLAFVFCNDDRHIGTYCSFDRAKEVLKEIVMHEKLWFSGKSQAACFLMPKE